jgi:hypothetical protein
MQDDHAPPTPLPPAAQSPYPPHPEPKVHSDLPVAAKAEPRAPEGLGVLGATLIGGAVAGAVGLLIAVPLLRRRAKAARKPAARRTRRKTN